MGTQERKVLSGLLGGLAKWGPFLALPAAMFLCEIRWQLQVYANDYEASRLTTKLRDLGLRIDAIEELEDRLKTQDLIEAKAPHLGLVKPGPSQIETVYEDHAGPTPLAVTPYELASLDIVSPTMLEPLDVLSP